MYIYIHKSTPLFSTLLSYFSFHYIFSCSLYLPSSMILQLASFLITSFFQGKPDITSLYLIAYARCIHVFVWPQDTYVHETLL